MLHDNNDELINQNGGNDMKLNIEDINNVNNINMNGCNI